MTQVSRITSDEASPAVCPSTRRVGRTAPSEVTRCYSFDDVTLPRSDATHTLLRQTPPPLGAIIRVEGAPASKTELYLSKGKCVLGAGADVDLIIDHKAVSRRHVELTLVAEGVAVRDQP